MSKTDYKETNFKKNEHQKSVIPKIQINLHKKSRKHRKTIPQKNDTMTKNAKHENHNPKIKDTIS